MSNGTSSPAKFSYNANAFDGAWDFHTVASQTRTVKLAWNYTGFHSFFNVTVGLNAFVTHGATTTTTPLVNAGPADCCTPPSGGFTYSGTISLPVQAGDTYGFKMSGHNFDTAKTLQGTLTVDDTDVTPPTISIVTPPDGANYGLNQSVSANYSCADEAGGSGLASCVGPVSSGSPIDTSTSGQHAFTVTATDNAGNTSIKTVHYTVLDQIVPFFPQPSLTTWKAGNTMPVKVTIVDLFGLPISNAEAANLLSPVCRIKFSAVGVQPVSPKCMTYSGFGQFFFSWPVGAATGSETFTITITYPNTGWTTTRSQTITIN